MKRYNPRELEPRWQKVWDDDGTYVADLDSKKPKYIAMSMFNYPSGAGIHIGHAMNYTISDVLARFKRQQGYESYHPVGWDSFGLPAENYAIKAGISPQESMAKIIPNYHKQYRAMGWSNDWSKEIAAHTPEYYKWSQWIFSEMYRAGLAYQDARMQWWCTKCQTVLANEQVIDDKCWRHDGPDDPIVAKKEVKQWFFKITEYADELLDATDDLNWTESVKLAQKNWIGRSQGTEITFKIDGSDNDITVFTTRPDTLYGATFMVLAPEHDSVKEITTDKQRELVDNYIAKTLKKTDVQRQKEADKQKTGVFTGAYAINPIYNAKIPIWIADYVLMGYGTGAIMAVPAHDQRDFEFAKKFELPVTQVVMPSAPDAANPPAPGLEEVERETVIVHLKNESTGKYAVLDWHGTLEGITTAIMGGVEKGQTPEDAVRAEICEEAGLESVKIVKTSPWITSARYHASHKNQNRKSISHGFLATIENLDDQQVVSETEKKLHTLMWVDKSEVLERLTPSDQKLVWEQLCETTAILGEGEIMNSGEYDGMSSSDAREKIMADLEKKGVAKSVTNYKMRDWSVSRQRYWGAPIPIINCPKDGPVLVSDNDLPVVLPELDDFQPSGDGRSALARAKDWLVVDCPKCGGPGERETDTLDTYIDSSWYMLRYFDPTNVKEAFSSKRANHWMPIDFYNGGDHATAHMLYARFVTRFLYNKGLLNNPEPFNKFLFNGKVTAQDGQMFSKSKGNGVDPLEIIEQGYGADALRTYLMFAAPLELWARWDPQGVPGTHRFLSRLWTLVQEYQAAPEEALPKEAEQQLRVAVNKMIRKVTEDIEENRYNTAISSLMATVNELYKIKVDNMAKGNVWQESLESMVMCVAPFAPYIAEDLWHQLGHKDTVHIDHWPQWDEKYLSSDTVKIVVQVNGKVRSTIEVETDSDEQTAVEQAKKDEKVQKYLPSEPKKVIFVKNRLINFVI
jgi:leucyl-tRNA synthetase